MNELLEKRVWYRSRKGFKTKIMVEPNTPPPNFSGDIVSHIYFYREKVESQLGRP